MLTLSTDYSLRSGKRLEHKEVIPIYEIGTDIDVDEVTTDDQQEQME